MKVEQQELKASEGKTVEISRWINHYFMSLRFKQGNHLGLGDIRLTVAMQDEIVELVRRMEGSELTIKEDIKDSSVSG